MNKNMLALLIMLMLTACAPAQPVAPTPYPTYTLYPTYTPYPTYTVVPSPTIPKPTDTPAPTANVLETIAVSKNDIETIEKSGVVIELVRVLVSERENYPDEWFDTIPAFDAAKTLIMFKFRVTNNTDGTISVLVKDHCNILVSGEQIDCDRLPHISYTSYEIDTIMTGVTREGFFYVPANTPRGDISTITIEFPGAFNSRGSGFTGDFAFTFDITDWVWTPKP